MLSVKHMTRKYKNGDSYIKAVNDITKDFKEGEFVFVLGHSGSGKSTLLNVLCGLDTEIEGSVIVDGIDTADFSKKDWAIYRNYYVGFIFQEYNLIEHLKIWENVALPLMFQGVSKKEAKDKALKELDKVGLLKMADKYPKQMSGGQNQRVAIARALVTNPKVIMADEPTGALDTELGYKVLEYIKKVASDKVVVVVTHDEELAEKYATRTIRLEDGNVLSDTNDIEVAEQVKQDLVFKQPKMGLKMMLKFAYNNVTSRMLRSILTSAIVSIGYISIFLLTFLIIGINTSISDVVGSLLPEDQYQVFSIENLAISEEDLNELNALDEVDHIRYNVSVSAYLDYRDDSMNITGLPVPYDTAQLTENGVLYGDLPSASNEIIINTTLAAQMRGLTSIDEDSYDYVFGLLEGQEIVLYDYVDSEFGDQTVIDSETYTIVGMTIDAGMTSLIYFEYGETLDLYALLENDEAYKDTALAYLNISKEEDIDALRDTFKEDYGLVLENYFTSITSSVEDFMFTALKILIGVASITLIVSGILIGLVVYTSIVERIKEIGILTAIGARANNIIGIFIAESAILGLLSSLIATVLAWLISVMLNGLFDRFIQQPLEFITQGELNIQLFSVNVWVILGVLLFSILYAMLAGLIPSFRAARLNAVKALRKE
jgi:ABC-type lipoprotein export system ATPase subunit/ABC-type lipoprotein release transport system permease subunit